MGLNFISTGGDSNPPRGNPVPTRFTINSIEERSKGNTTLCIAEVLYPDARNYEGKKILVYVATEKQLRQAAVLDPHFQECTGPTVPIARFEPTDAGWYLARILVRYALQDQDQY